MGKKTVEQQIVEFMLDFGSDRLTKFLEDILPLFELFDVEDTSNWVTDVVGKENEAPVTMIRTVYLMSIIAENHAGTLCTLKMRYKDLWKKMEIEAKKEKHGQEDQKVAERH